MQDWEIIEEVGDLDECNGRTGSTPEYPDGTYYYVIRDEFPFIPRNFRGTPDDSFRRRGPGRRIAVPKIKEVIGLTDAPPPTASNADFLTLIRADAALLTQPW